MNSYIGIDLGTSSLKLLLVDSSGRILNEVSENYAISYPQKGWSEQNPEDWLKAVKSGIERLIRDVENIESVKGISFGGQMHGLVILDKEDKIIRPCILWNDGRTEKQTEFLNEKIGKKKLSEYMANIAFAGFTAPKILWVKENEPQNFERINKIMLPKDYLAYCLTSVHSTDYSDASGTLLLDVKNKCWSKEMCEICDVKIEHLPKLHESYEVIGTLKQEAAKEFGLSENVIVTAGAGDNAAAAIGTGTMGNGGSNISLGTSGTIFISSDTFSVDKQNSLHSFCHADGGYHLMGCILSAASCNKWWMENILKTEDFSAEQKNIEKYLGKNDVFFLPYLSGERSPHNDTNAKGAFIGITHETTREQMTLAVLEGVAFAIRDCLEVAKANSLKITKSKICGGGAKSKIWTKIMSNVLGVEIETLITEQGPAYGAAILAMVGAGEYGTVTEAAAKLIKTANKISPSKELTEDYNAKYNNFKLLYPALKESFGVINE